MKIRIKKLLENAVVPRKAHDTDAAYDLTATSVRILPNGAICYGTGIALEIPKGYAGFIYPRSSVRSKLLTMSNCVGVIDSGYRGEVMLSFFPEYHLTLWGEIKRILHIKNSQDDFVTISEMYEPGERIGQLIVRSVANIEFIEAEELDNSDRGTGGHGSSGK